MPTYINDALSLNEICPILIQRLHCTYKCQTLTSASSGNKLQTDSVTKTMLEHSYRNNYLKYIYIFFKVFNPEGQAFLPTSSIISASHARWLFLRKKQTFFSRPMIYMSLFNINTILELRNV